jgi:heme exporter protein C
MGLRAAMEDVQRADRTSAVLAIIGVVNVPIIHFSVIWWNSLHQAPSLLRPGGPAIQGGAMLIPLLMMILGFTLFFVTILLVRLRGEVLSRERSASWIREAVTP